MSAVQRVATNQTPPLEDFDRIGGDAALTGAVRALGGEHADAVLSSLTGLGRLGGSAEAREHGRLANRHDPELTVVDRYGNRIDEVRFHPSWHWLMEQGVAAGLQAAPWTSTDPLPHLRRAAGFIGWSQVEQGHLCPLSMTYAAVPALRRDELLAKEWVPGLASTRYAPGLAEPSSKPGLLAGMGMTEKQGGSDVRTNLTTATPTADDGEYDLTGHKWFTSAPMNDVFLVLAQAPDGLSCFVLPRVLPDGTRNRIEIVRLKDKLGNRSNASSELELVGARARLLGEEGRGVRTIIEMVAATRLDCVLGSASLMRSALAEASWHVAHRTAFGARLADQPAMRNVVADLAVESDAATLLGLRLAAAVDRADDPHEQALRRIGLPLAKFWVCKRTPWAVAEAMECLGGNGYVEDSGLPQLFRESPLNSIWEGSGNVNALDVLRALQREPAALEAWLAEIAPARGENTALDAAVDSVLTSLADLHDMESRARRLAGLMAACLQGALLLRHGDPDVADAFCASRLGGDWGGTFGTLPPSAALASIVARTTPQPVG
jgi:putative acyl-CoA dehydrogenase